MDPSNVDPDALDRGFSVNCFAKLASGLPQGKQGDVLTLHGLQVGRTQSISLLLLLTLIVTSRLVPTRVE